MNLPDRTLAHLCDVVARPDLSGTPYEEAEFIGSGGMGAVYRVRDTRLDRQVALKVMDGPILPEARLLAQLEHPGIVPVYDTGELQDGRSYFAMRLVEGVHLDVYLAHEERSLSERLSLFGKICEAVAFAHSRGVIHRDLKPENIMVGTFGEVVVLDWGVASWKETGSRMIAGTPRWMAPEQSSGGPIDQRTDIFALGLLLKKLLTGLAPRPLAAIGAKASGAEPGGRYSSVEQLIQDLRSYQDHLPVLAYRESWWEKAVRFGNRNRFLLLLLATYVAVRILLVFI